MQKFLPALLLLASCAWGAAAPVIEPGVSLALAQERANTLSRVSYDLFVRIPEDPSEALAGRVLIRFDWRGGDQPLQIDFSPGVDHVLGVNRGNEAVAYHYSREHIIVAAEALTPGANALEIRFRSPQGSVNRNPQYLFTLFVPDRARTAFPLFDQPDIKARYTLILDTPADWHSLGNAPLAETTVQGERRQSTFRRTEPLSSYQFAFVSGRFETVTRSVGQRRMTLLHRETDSVKLERNLDAIFSLHGNALGWLENYTNRAYPFSQFNFALIPDLPYGGMEHVGAIQYRTSSLLLDEDPAPSQRLRRAQLIAHETAHMWFGNLVTMRWFNDVWTKEVFANFMADKIVNPEFADIDHQLSFLTSHYPQAMAVDRSAGANPIRQDLDNLNLAGQMYGPIIYHKAPIMMRQLELLMGEEAFRDGLREYLQRFAFANATWPGLIAILDARSNLDLASWSEVWVSSPGMPEFVLGDRNAPGEAATRAVAQRDPAGLSRQWPQTFSVATLGTQAPLDEEVLSSPFPAPLSKAAARAPSRELLFNANGLGYGVFPADLLAFERWELLSPLQRGAALINAREDLLRGGTDPLAHFDALREVLATEDNDLLLKLAGEQLRQTYFGLLDPEQRSVRSAGLEALLWTRMREQSSPGMTRVFFEQLTQAALTRPTLEKLHSIWSGELTIDHLTLAESERISLAEILAVRMPDIAAKLISAQLESIDNPDRRRRFAYIAPALGAEVAGRDAFFATLADPQQRATEAWTSDALGLLHDPTRIEHSAAYIPRSLELLEEIQVTGDIFFPSAWLNQTLRNHVSDAAAASVRRFLESRSNYNPQLRMKILQAADPLYRAQQLRQARLR